MNAATGRNLRYHLLSFLKTLPQYGLAFAVFFLYSKLMRIPFRASIFLIAVVLMTPLFILLQNGNILLGSILSYSLSRKNFLIGVHVQCIFHATLATMVWVLVNIFDKDFLYSQPIYILACFCFSALVGQIGFFYGLCMKLFGKLGYALYLITFVGCMVAVPIAIVFFNQTRLHTQDLSAAALQSVPIFLVLYLLFSISNRYLVLRKFQLTS